MTVKPSSFGRGTARTLVFAVVTAACATLLLSAGAAAEVTFKQSIGVGGDGALGFQEPGGVAINNATGDVYVADRQRMRIQEFTENGAFVRMWGFDVVASGEDDKPAANEVQRIKVRGTAGRFRFGFEGQTTGGTATGTLASGSPTVTALSTASGTGDLSSGSSSINNWAVNSGQWEVGQPIAGPGIPAGTVVTEVSFFSMQMSKNASSSTTGATLTSPGPFPFAAGQTIVGPGIPAGTKIQAASEGTLTLSNNATAAGTGVSLSAGLPYDATPGEVETALEALPKVNAGGGGVTVTGGPGDASGSNPYVVTFDTGPVAGKNVGALRLEGSGLAIPSGDQLRCLGEAESAEPRGFHEFQWLANGQEIPGATSSTYTTTGGDAGKSIQCRVETTFDISQELQTTLNVSTGAELVAPIGSQSPPEGQLNAGGLVSVGGPNRTPSITGPTLAKGGPGGTLTCNAGAWSETPTGYTYQWFVTGEKLGAPVTTAATSVERTFTPAEVAHQGIFQCQVTATNAGGSATMMSDWVDTEPGAEGSGVDFVEFPAATLEAANGVDPSVTTTNGGAVFEICKANPPSTDVCKTGVAGSSAGQFDRPRGIAVDNSPGGGGAVYVGDDWNFRIQKFSATGTPIAVWGKNVNKTTGAAVCTVASGDACGIAIRNIDGTTGVFGGWPTSNEQGNGSGGEYAELGDTVAVNRTNGEVYVTDPYALLSGTDARLPRVQKLDPNGGYLGQIKTSGFTGSGAPLSVAVDSQGTAYVVGTGEQRAVSIFEASEFTPEGTLKPFSERNTFDEDQEPKQVAVDPNNDDKIWITDRSGNDACQTGIKSRRAVMAFDHLGHLLDCSTPEELGALPATSGLAISPSGLAFISVKGQNRIKVYELPQETPPAVKAETVSRITTETAKVHATVNPGFEPTTYTVEYGPADCSSNPCTKVAGSEPAYGLKDVSVNIPIDALTPGTTYHYRVVADNPLGTVPGQDRTFTSFPFVDLVNDPCPNALARKQTRTAGLLDCRAYELASASFTGGYDVVSDLAPGLSPQDGYPDAEDKLAYSVRDGGIPGTGSPTNRGPDPYVAIRGDDGWSTRYVGIPADGGFSAKPFSSTLADADSALDTFVFAGPDICSPCFADGSAGAPLRLPDGSLVQGMLGSVPQPAAVPAGYVGDRLSADGRHFVFGSTSKFEPGGDSGGSIYDRNLETKTTQVVSTLPSGSAMTGGGVGELDISDDGSHIVVAQKVSTDAKGNVYWHPYMHIGTESKSVDLAPGTTTGVLYAGMSSDGSSVFFSTKDKLLGTDTDASADVYRATVSGTSSTLSLVSVKGANPSNDDSCLPAGEIPWNKASGAVQDCSAVVLAGGAGVAEDGTVYFVSPELLEGPADGKASQPNLFAARPGGQPRFVATIDDSTNEDLHPLPGPPLHPASTVISGLSTPEALAVDQSNGDIFVAERGAGRVSRYTSAGVAKPFSAVQPYIEGNRITGQNLGGEDENGIAFDSAAGSPLKGSLYVTSNGSTVNIFSSTGEKIGALTGFGEACGVAVDQSTGTVFVGNYFGNMRRFVPISGATPVTNANYLKTGINMEGLGACEVGADSAGHAYAMGYGTGPLKVFNVSEFTAGEPTVEGEEVTAKTGNPPANTVPPSYAVNSDPANGDLYVNNGSKIVQLNSSLTPLGEFGAGAISGSRGVAVNGTTKHTYAVNGSGVVEFGIEPQKFVAVDNPMVVHAVDDNEIHRWGDFQTTPDGTALFGTKVRQSESYDNGGFDMAYRYDAVAGEVACVSCLTTEGVPTGDASLPSHGLGITDDKRVFFNSPDQLEMRDTNAKLDAYEWRDGQISLISTGFSNAPASLLTVTADGRDAFFFTRETLVAEDLNGQAMKLYDAREKGGFFVVPNSPPCAASDECHGPGSEAAAPPPIGSFKGVGGQRKPAKCKTGFVKKGGKCKKKKARKHKKSNRKRAANTGRGGNR